LITDRVRLLLALALLMPAYGSVFANDPKPADPATDDELLEFLGSVDAGSDSQTADDGSWIDYLSQTDIGTAAKKDPNGGSGGKQAAAGAQPPASGAKKDE
jgi:hypothetical protein